MIFMMMIAACLLLGKIIISAFLFPGLGGILPVSNLALAQNQPAPDPKEDAGNNTGMNTSDALAEKEQALKEKEQQLKQQESELLPLKKEIEEKLSQLNELQTNLAAYAKKLAEREKSLQDAKMNHLVDLYSSMEPANAAAIMEKLKIDTVVTILKYMKGKSAGQILAQMKPDIGAAISEKLSQAE
jgi:flagellar motility protein MotE (MotC chaperone)